jgi:signal transduction histidine kinase/CheY-like chemotaxis protein
VRRALVAHLKGQTEDYQSEHRMRHRDGHYLWVFERGKAMSRSPDGRALRLVGTYSDITRLKQAEQALRDKQAAELASQAKTEFLSRMSHEIRTPLNAMIGFAQLLGMSANRADPVQVRDYAGHMLQAGRHLLALINDVLDLQRVEAGQLAFTPETLHLGTVVAEALELLAPMALQASVSIDNRIEAHWNVRADAQRTRQVLINLVSNAIKYNRSPGHVLLRCGVAGGQHLRLDIEDTGTGLDASQLDRLFQPFERLGRETSSVEGTGLGLLIAKRLVEEMGGRIAVCSTPGVGTTVSIELPRDDAGRALLGTAPSAAVAPAQVTQRRDGDVLRMLYVEDNPINALLFEEAMKLCSHVELRVAEDGPQAFSLVRGWRPDILVLDAHLPGKSGFEVLEDLRHHHGLHETPAFMCSADAMPDDIERARAAGFVGYWTKPISLDKVLADVERVAPRPTARA